MPKPVKVIISGENRLGATLTKASIGLDKFGAKARKIGKGLTLGLTLPLLGLGAASLKASTTFNEGMAQVATLVPGNVKRVQELGSSVKQLAVDTGKGTDDITSGLYQTISAFGDSEETVGRLTIALRASKAGAADTQSTLSMLSGVTKAYGDTSEQALQKVSDLAFKTVELGETTFPELASQMGKVNALGVTLGVTQEELFATFAAGTGPLGDTASVSTKLAGAMVALMKPSGDMQKAFEKLGVSTGKELIAQKGFRGALQAVTDVANKHGVSLAKIYGRSEALQLALSLTGAQAKDFEVKLGAMNSAAGATDRAYKEMTEGVNKAGFTFAQFKQKVNVLAIDIGDKLAPALVIVLDKVSPLINKFLGLSDKTKGWILTVAGIAAAIGPALVVVGVLASTLSKLTLVIKGVGFALQFLAMNPVGLIITAVGLLAIGIYALIKNWDKVVGFFKVTWNWLSGFLKSKVGTILSFMFPFVGIPLQIAANWDKVVAVFKKVLSVGASLGAKVKGWFGGKNAAETASTTVGGLNNGTTPAPVGPMTARAAESVAGTSRVESTTNIKIDNKADAKIRTQVDKGSVNLETLTGELIPATG